MMGLQAVFIFFSQALCIFQFPTIHSEPFPCRNSAFSLSASLPLSSGLRCSLHSARAPLALLLRELRSRWRDQQTGKQYKGP